MLYTYKEFETINHFSTPSTLTNDELELILAYLQGMVNLWCAVCGDKPFSARDFIGGENYDWKGTPLMAAWEGRYNHYRREYPDETSENLAEWTHGQCAKDVGHLLKQVLIKHRQRHFVSLKGFGNAYQWIKDKK
ncbi:MULTISPECIES: hypothetical protein [unclassified Moraxella]|uniref:hypothetical protein n=1 Tax=unclassified Moraxella TaxID=2685852 RepID=UPI00359DFBDF